MNSKNTRFRPVLVLAPGVLAGAEKVVLTGLSALHEEGLNPLMIIIRETRIPELAYNFDQMIPPHIERRIIDSTKALDIKLPHRLKEAIADQTLPLVLHSHGFKALIACYMAKGQRPHVHTHHGNTAHTLKVRIYEKMAMMTMKSCRAVIAVSQKMQQELAKSLSPFKNIVVIENMLSLKNAAKIREERKTNPTPSNQKIHLIYVGRISPEKGLLSFLESWGSSSKKDHFTLSILGDGVDRSRAQELVLNLGLKDVVKFHGFVADPSAFFQSPDALIMPSLREGLPMTLIEALASGVPVVANNVGAISSLVKHGQNGFLTKDQTLSSWHEALNETILHVNEWKINAEKEASRVEERFSAKSWAKKTKELYLKELS